MRHADAKTTGMGAMIRSMAWDLGLPVATYYGLHAAGASDVAALLAGTGAAGLRLVWVAVRSRTVSAFSAVMGGMFLVGLLFTVLTGDARIMLVKHSAMAAVVGIAFAVTAFRGRPLTLLAQQSFRPGKAAEMAAEYAADPHVRHGHRVASLVWGAGLLTEAVVRVVLVYSLPVSVMVGLSTVLTVVTFTGLLGWTARYTATAQRRAEAASAPAASDPVAATPAPFTNSALAPVSDTATAPVAVSAA
jgi:hypothetical protein